MKQPLLIVLLFILFIAPLTAQQAYNKGVKVETLLKTDTTAIGQKIVFPSSTNDEVTIARITLPPGTSTGWHKHDRPVFAYVVSGVLKVRMQNGKVNEFLPSTTFAEMVDVYHEGFNDSTTDVVLIAFYLGEKDRPLSTSHSL